MLLYYSYFLNNEFYKKIKFYFFTYIKKFIIQISLFKMNFLFVESNKNFKQLKKCFKSFCYDIKIKFCFFYNFFLNWILFNPIVY